MEYLKKFINDIFKKLDFGTLVNLGIKTTQIVIRSLKSS